MGRFKTASTIIDEKIINGNLFDVVEETIRFIKSHLKVAFEITGKTTNRTEIFDYPVAAIRELVLNSIIHRDYRDPSDIQIKIFDQSIRFYNPGNLYGNITIEDLQQDNYTSKLRNVLIAEAFYLTKDIEKYGTGFSRIRKEIMSYPTMSFNCYEQAGGFVAELAYTEQKISTTPTITPTINVALSRLETKIVELIKNDKNISMAEMAKQLSISRDTIIEYIKKLKKRGIVQRFGTNRAGYWEVSGFI